MATTKSQLHNINLHSFNLFGGLHVLEVFADLMFTATVDCLKYLSITMSPVV